MLGLGHGNISHAPFFVKRGEIMVYFLICMLSIPNSEGMKNLKVDEDYTSFFKANPSLLSEPGVKVIQTPGETTVISIGYAEIKTKNSVGKLNAEKIATMKARASIVGDRKGIRVYEKKELVENSQVVNENGIENFSSPRHFETFLDNTKGFGYASSDLKDLYLSREQMASLRTSSVMTQDELLHFRK